MLAASGVRATFFVIGNYTREQKDLLRRIAAAGHVVGNHTMTHPWLTNCWPKRVREEISGCNRELEDVLGQRVRYFRPPHGARLPVVFDVTRELGLKTVQWNVMGQDWKPIGEAGILARVDRGMVRARHRGRGANILLHDGWDKAQGADRSATIAVTRTLLSRWSTQSIRPVTVDVWG